ncbi:DUF1501 domain-containing protein [Gemmata sp.]|uniref:DUF1501 domain-containing protein n=1 Tax=Gemmata sp. TaxID=1914242 RepID=UPI003F71BBBC
MLDLPRYFASPAESAAYRSRREFLARAGGGFGMLALADLLRADEPKAAAPPGPLSPHEPHFPAKAKRVIWLFMNGGPSQVDTWDYKPELEKRDGKELEGFDPNTGFFTGQVGPLMKSPFKFAKQGQCGKMVSELFPHLGKHVDKMAFVHSLWSDSNNHSPALFKMNTGMARMGFPCVGSWVTYGLGTESQSLPAFCVMYDTLGRGIPKGHSVNWGAGFLPTVFQGTAFKPQGDPIDNLTRPADLPADRQRQQLDLLARLNKQAAARTPNEPELAARVETFELAYRMQMAAPEALDLAKETAETKKMYGLDNPKATHFAKQCLIARRLVERGVRFVQIYSGGMENDLSWDGHNNIAKNHGGFAQETDQPIAGLLEDLSRRGLLDDTLVIWGGEFGRLPIVQKGNAGRDHNPHAMTYWLAGGGVKGGVSYGASDEIGFKAVENRVSVNDFHATVLHLMGLDHKKLTYRYNGRDFRLTDVAGTVVKDILV